MKARVELVVRDEEGNILSQLDPYWMELSSQSLHDIEGAVENWKQKVLPDIEADLLARAQDQFTQQVKKQWASLQWDDSCLPTGCGFSRLREFV